MKPKADSLLVETSKIGDGLKRSNEEQAKWWGSFPLIFSFLLTQIFCLLLKTYSLKQVDSHAMNQMNVQPFLMLL